MFPVLPAFPAADQAPLAEVYQAVYGDKPLPRRLRQPRFAEVTDLAATPRLLVRLSAGRYALVTSQDADTMVHIAQGAISIAYVERTPAGWRLRARWDEVAWTGGTGRAATTITAVFAPSRPPRIVVIDNNLIQGQVQVERSTIALDKDGPRLLATVYKDLPPEPIEDR